MSAGLKITGHRLKTQVDIDNLVKNQNTSFQMVPPPPQAEHLTTCLRGQTLGPLMNFLGVHQDG
jgi:hypothetical protein